MTQILSEDSHVYCLWFVPFHDNNNFFAAMFRDEDGDRVIYRFDDSDESRFYMIHRGDSTMRDFRLSFNRTVEHFSDESNAVMEYIPVDGDINRALDIIERQPWGEEVLTR